MVYIESGEFGQKGRVVISHSINAPVCPRNSQQLMSPQWYHPAHSKVITSEGGNVLLTRQVGGLGYFGMMFDGSCLAIMVCYLELLELVM
jgi:hypothetical protein